MLNDFLFHALNLQQKALLVLLVFTALVQVYFYLAYFLKLANYNGIETDNEPKALSVIVAAHNEAENLKLLIPALLKQRKVDFEIVIVDDGSTDDTQQVLKEFGSSINVIYNKNNSGKKEALKKGIESARHKYFVFTDADCMPESDFWLYKMSQAFSQKVEIVLGYGGFYKEPGLLNKLIRFEASLVATQYFSFALKGKAYMGVGRNLAYTKGIYNRSKAFIQHAEMLSGDDDLLVNEMATEENVGVCTQAETHTYSHAERSWKKLFFQKRRQLQAGNRYKTEHRFLLGLFGFSNILYYALLVSMFVQPQLHLYILVIFVIKQLLQYYLFNRIFQKFKNQDLVKWILFLEPFYLIFITFVGVSTWLWKVDKWK